MDVKKLFLITVLITLCQLCFGQKIELPKLPQDGKSISDFVPKDWRIAKQIEGDLNGDEVADSVLILQGTKDEFIQKSLPSLDIEIVKKTEETGENEHFRDFNPAILVVLIKEGENYKLFALNHRIIPPPDGFRKWDSNISIKNNTLTLELVSNVYSSTLHPWDFQGNKTYKFHFQNSQMVLAEAELNSGKIKYDFLKEKGFFTITENEKTSRYKINQLIPLEKLKANSTDNVFSLGYLHFDLNDSDKNKKSLIKVFDGRENIPFVNTANFAEEIEIVEKEIRNREKEIKELAKSDDFQCEKDSFRVIDWANGTFFKTKAKSVKKRINDPMLPNYSYTVEPHNAFLYQLCYSGNAQYATYLGGIIITEKGKIKEHFTFNNISGFYSIKSLPDINKNGLSELVLEFTHNVNSLNFVRAIGVFEIANAGAVELAEIDIFKRLENDEDEDIAYKIFVKKAKKPVFYQEIYTSEEQKNDWKLKEKLTKISSEKFTGFKFQQLLPINSTYFDLIPKGHPPAISAPDNFDKLILEFKDASVKPESQRNYKITLTKNSAEIVLESYKVLDRETVKIPEAKFNEIVKIVEKANLRKRLNLDDDGCSGGTTDIFEFFNDENSVFKGLIYHCGGDDFGDLIGDSNSIKNALTLLFPKVKAKFRNIE